MAIHSTTPHAVGSAGLVDAGAGDRRLIVMAGPSAVGKSYLIRGFRNGSCSALATAIGFDTSVSWSFQTIGSVVPPWPAQLFLHYDTTRPVRGRVDDFFGDQKLADVLNAFDDVWFVTLTADRDAILKRYIGRRYPLFNRLGSLSLLKMRHRCNPLRMKDQEQFDRVLNAYSSEGGTDVIHRQWVAFCDSIRPDRHCTVDVSHREPLIRLPGRHVDSACQTRAA